jgi:hypothetical protein
MDKYFTNNYKIIKTLYNYPIMLDAAGRWLCYCHIDKINNEKDEITLYDNYCERYIINYNKVSNEFVILNGRGSFRYGEIILHFSEINHPLPNFAIDVMQTFANPVAFETLRRQAEIIANNYRYEK